MHYCDAIKEGFFYHYTSLTSLALILKNKTLRLFPLSGMDDVQEQFASDSHEYGKFVYVSSWTKSKKEIISMWKMYCREKEGIRIGLAANPFKVCDFFEDKYYEVDEFEPSKEKIENGIMPFCHVVRYDDHGFIVRNPMYGCQLFEVEYSDEPDKLFPKVISDDCQVITLDGSNMGLIKNTYWEFQQEVRYKIVLGDNQLEQRIRYNCINKDTDELLLEKVDKLPAYIDLHLSDKALADLEITLSPDFSESNRILLESLVKQYNPNTKIRESLLKDLVR